MTASERKEQGELIKYQNYLGSLMNNLRDKIPKGAESPLFKSPIIKLKELMETLGSLRPRGEGDHARAEDFKNQIKEAVFLFYVDTYIDGRHKGSILGKTKKDDLLVALEDVLIKMSKGDINLFTEKTELTNKISKESKEIKSDGKKSKDTADARILSSLEANPFLHDVIVSHVFERLVDQGLKNKDLFINCMKVIVRAGGEDEWNKTALLLATEKKESPAFKALEIKKDMSEADMSDRFDSIPKGLADKIKTDARMLLLFERDAPKAVR